MADDQRAKLEFAQIGVDAVGSHAQPATRPSGSLDDDENAKAMFFIIRDRVKCLRARTSRSNGRPYKARVSKEQTIPGCLSSTPSLLIPNDEQRVFCDEQDEKSEAMRKTAGKDVLSGLLAAWALSFVPARTHAHAFSLQQLHQQRSPSPEPQPGRRGDDDDSDKGHGQSDYSPGNPHFPVPGTAITMTTSLNFFNPTPSLSGTAALPTATSTPFLVFEPIQNTTVCGSNAIPWEYAGDESFALALGVTNVHVDGADPQAPPITQILDQMEGGLRSSNTFKWSPVALPAGAYAAFISIPNAVMLYYSTTFYVFNSSDHSCLDPSQPTSSPGGASTSSLTSSSQANTGTTLPVEGAVSSKGLSGGGIAGIVIGLLALVALGGALLVLLRRCRSRTAASSALFGRTRRMSGYIEKRDPPAGSPGSGSRGIGGFPGPGGRGSMGPGGVGAGRPGLGGAVGARGGFGGFGGGSSDFAVHSVNRDGGSSQDDVASVVDAEKPVEDARISAFDFDADAQVLGVMTVPLALHRDPLSSYRDSESSIGQGGQTGRAYAAGGPSRSSSYSARSAASDPFDSDSGATPTSSLRPSPMPSSRLSLTPSVADPFNPFASPADLEQNQQNLTQAGGGGGVSRGAGDRSRERQVPVQLFMPSASAASSPRPGIPRDISMSSSRAESDADTYTYEHEPDHLSLASEGATTTTATMVPPLPQRRMPPVAPAMSAGRRTMSSRKPVPVYAPSVSGEALELAEPATPRSAYYYHSSSAQSTHSGNSGSGSGNDWSSAAAHSHSPATASPMSSGSHLPPAHTWNKDTRDSNAVSTSGSTTSVLGGASTISPSSPTTLGSPSTVVNGHASFLSGHQYLPELNHKSSFGDRPVHYLIPDPPSENVL